MKKERRIFLCFCLWMAGTLAMAQHQGNPVTLSAVNEELAVLLRQVEQQSDYYKVNYNYDDVSQYKVSIDVKGVTAPVAVKTLLKELPLKSFVSGRYIHIRSARAAAPEGKSGVVSGHITDNMGEPLIGVTVVVEDSKKATVTDSEGNFSLPDVRPDDILIFTYVGKKVLRRKAGTRRMHIILEDDETLMKDIIVIGYGSKDRKSLTSSISSLNQKDVAELAPTSTSLDNLLAGTVKGVRSIENSGEPGGKVNVNIRGITSPFPVSGAFENNNAPLYVIDGVPQFVASNALNPLLALSPNDIESVDILKDASATAIYGSRGANGVIIVKTKNGRKGDKVSVEAGYNLSIGNAVKKYKPLTTGEFKTLQNEILNSTSQYISQAMDGMLDSQLYEMLSQMGNFDVTELMPGIMMLNAYSGLNENGFGTANTNWVDEIENRNAATHRYNASVRGGSEKTNYSFSLNGMNQEGLFVNDKLSRYGTRLFVDTEINSHLKVGGTLDYTFSKRNSGSMPEGYSSGTDPYRVRPDIPVYDVSGAYHRYDEAPAYGFPLLSANPVARRYLITESKSFQFSGNAYFDATITRGLRLHGDVNVATYSYDNNYFIPSSAQSEAFGTKQPAILMEDNMRSTFTSVNLRANYDVNIRDHNLGFMVGLGRDRTFNDSKIFSASDFTNETILHNIGSANVYMPITDSYVRGGLNSVYSRVTYDYAQRYLAELSFRADESSKFGPGNRWGYFPALSLGWHLKNEKFLRDYAPVSDLKLRLSWGKTGSTNVADFSYIQYFSKQGSYGEQSAIRLQNTLPNRDIKWEMTTEYNFGVDYSFLNNRIRGSLDLYTRKTDGALTLSPYIVESGMEEYYANLIDMSNRGLEFELSADIIRMKDFTWTSSFNISTNRNKVEHLNGASLNSAMQDYIVEGEPAGVTKGYVVDKIIQKQDDIDALNATATQKGFAYFQDFDTGVGDWLFKDVNGDGHISVDDRIVIASPQPDFFGGWINSLTYKNFSLYFVMQFTQGGEAVYSAVRSDLLGTLGNSVTRETFGNTWTPGNTSAAYPRLVTSRTSPLYSALNDRYVFSTSFLRMKDITLSYSLPKSWISSWMQSAKLYATLTNLFTISNWPGIDPELCGTGVMGMVENEDPYPMSRTFTIGINVKF